MGMNTVNFSWVFHAISRYYFFAVNHFKSLYWIWYNIFSVLCFGFFWSWRLWHLSSLTRDQTYTLCTGRQSRNHWTTREDPAMPFFDSNTPIGSPFPALLFPMLACRHYWCMTASHANYTASCSSFTINGMNWIFLSWVPWFAQKSCLTVLISGVLPWVLIKYYFIFRGNFDTCMWLCLQAWVESSLYVSSYSRVDPFSCLL